ncbi:N-acetylglucosamine-6-phosphate deacetylase [Chlorogloea sp. CCALA 695]|uniref:N-acetylglucosamine-6-phosphate deacetylase n=1 Tax=Chlorogloea sp. CCALA 695 TaxID=2107693 RepID=UPI000D04B099|nr:N-acetylglucosamine-6-phosphate deacetylase [Chlorogloea sp. CCALA 695]PSB34562.1 N-acetylglucosamine-6-phosphate deacetylase [Chlorogloea sp. CCALA 695]
MNSAIANLDIINARVPGYESSRAIRVDPQGKVSQILYMHELAGESKATQRLPKAKKKLLVERQVLDVCGDCISLGGVDLQINGALGLAFTDLQAQDSELLSKICQFLWQQGINSFVPTLVTTSVENIKRVLAILANFIDSQKPTQSTAQILGVHLEGPFLNPEKRGAHPVEYLLPLTIDNLKHILGEHSHIVKIVTLAPEIDTTKQAIPYLKDIGITVSLGHSQATAAQAERAFELGASMVTHAFNAMPSLHHREPGLLGAALINPIVKCGLIADGQHICPTMIQVLLQASNYEQGLFLVSDALAPLGLPDGIYPWDTRQITVTNGTARLPDNTLSGTTLPLFTGVQNLVKWGICEVESAIALATNSPRQAINISSSIENAIASQLIRWHFDSATKNLTWARLTDSFASAPPQIDAKLNPEKV